MKIGISATGEDLNAQVDPRFGRCQYFLIVDTETMGFESISNESAMTSGGAGIQAAQTIAKAGVDAMVTGNMGPNAFQTLSAAGIRIFTGATGKVSEAVEQYKRGELQETKGASVNSHFGMGGTGRSFGRGRNL
ncbi:MAG: NifB/NifX family molybdenum-iron cluster-binding protein [Candidatus Thermoplasmatota archaeon]|nr:NifB/NifX family molybdenum-iron cluster-binding protein [Candidatus Thermoplasmatota archaeon]